MQNDQHAPANAVACVCCGDAIKPGDPRVTIAAGVTCGTSCAKVMIGRVAAVNRIKDRQGAK